MNSQIPFRQNNFAQPLIWFAIGWTLLLLVPMLPQLPGSPQAAQPWRVELLASFGVLPLIFWMTRRQWSYGTLARRELLFLIAPCLAFIAWSGLSAAWSEMPKAAAHHALAWACYLIFYCLFREIVETPKLLRGSFYALGAVVWAISLPCILEYFLITDSESSINLRIRYSQHAESINTLLPLFLVLTLKSRGRAFWLAAGTVLLGWIFILTTLSRIAFFNCLFITFLLTVVCLLTTEQRKVKQRLIIMLCGLIAAAFFTQVFSFGKTETTSGRFASEEAAGSTNTRALYYSVAWQMLRENILNGVGANNYGVQFAEYRARYAAVNSADKNLSLAEEVLAERAHSEYLQILAELGIVGGALFGGFLGGVALLFRLAVKRGKRLSPLTVAALLGIVAFLTSSFVSSLSFRLLPNGLVFFFVLALAAKDLFAEDEKAAVVSPRLILGFSCFGMTACLLLAALSTARGLSQLYLAAAQREQSIEDAVPLYETAAAIDSENASAHYLRGVRLMLKNRSAEAVPLLERAVNKGMTATPGFSYLASAQTLAGDVSAAEATMAEAARIYPRSVFVRMRYAALLEQNGKNNLSFQQREIAARINPRQAAGWWLLITEGAQSAASKAYHEKQSAAPMDLRPQNALYAFLAERELMHPEEKMKLDF